MTSLDAPNLGNVSTLITVRASTLPHSSSPAVYTDGHAGLDSDRIAASDWAASLDGGNDDRIIRWSSSRHYDLAAARFDRSHVGAHVALANSMIDDAVELLYSYLRPC